MQFCQSFEKCDDGCFSYNIFQVSANILSPLNIHREKSFTSYVKLSVMWVTFLLYPNKDQPKNEIECANIHNSLAAFYQVIKIHYFSNEHEKNLTILIHCGCTKNFRD